MFDEFEFHVYRLTAEDVESRAEPFAIAEPGPGRNLPPMSPEVPSLVTSYLADPQTGLEEPGTYQGGGCSRISIPSLNWISSGSPCWVWGR